MDQSSLISDFASGPSRNDITSFDQDMQSSSDSMATFEGSSHSQLTSLDSYGTMSGFPKGSSPVVAELHPIPYYSYLPTPPTPSIVLAPYPPHHRVHDVWTSSPSPFTIALPPSYPPGITGVMLSPPHAVSIPLPSPCGTPPTESLGLPKSPGGGEPSHLQVFLSFLCCHAISYAAQS